ncbi:MAG: Imidazole glycerol phosphate synthase subunit HisH 1 [Alphaproteobacteria bacterium MarineAlpha5_Bin8]|nr:MAG: Imidazole glycerol phosphate synthase subunit HisH 1 [Alphaproteobacteria bacterium MarineAlpha5_Bin7]PPR48163.1 MAG: Imidazole glycerol phosphate synthase subunit HisH 1 [Alphaproteobacteria bacterium MarineAlpha5_Bin8]PPR54738.1 MAG: Imidazole glycerol phosphate synthase subunit HisH 1 [Alphaproteobacteria bacterium MarineAlpha5_Bin6]|tara:strand:+ start:3348 stop:3980 length:633 start_codon:yes stop_codon:yes gene_type:complete
MKKNIAIVDYGLGNILSAKQSFVKASEDNKIKAAVKITNDPKEIDLATHIVLPGQGAFEACMLGLKNIPDMIDRLCANVIHNKKPFLGICVGMQLLANTSYENGKHKGLGWIRGEIKKIPSTGIKLPHMGWNEVTITNKNKLINLSVLKNYYFVHSYYFDCKYSTNQIGRTNYGIDFASFISKENIYGVQFHPEKSSNQGLEIIKNFLML